MVVRGVTTRKAGKVLIINSDPEIIHILGMNLVHANLEIVSAQSGSEALTKIQNDNTDIIILDPALPDMEGAEIYRRITEVSQINHTPVIIISAKLPRIARIEDIPIYHITKPFDPKEVVALVQGYLMHKERMIHINPLTGLPNRLQISKEIDRLIRQKRAFAAIYIVLHDLKAINKVYGYAQGDRVVQLLADIVSEAVRLFGNAEDLAGYFGGDKFVIVSTPWKARALCRKIIADFNKRIQVLCNEEFLQMSLAANESLSLNKEQAPVMSIHIAQVSNQKRRFYHSLEVTEAALEQIEYLGRSPESNCYFDFKLNQSEPCLTLARRELVPAYKEGLKTIQDVLAWFDFLTRELNTPINVMKECLDSLKSIKVENLSEGQINSLKTLHYHHSQLTRVVESIASLAKFEDIDNGTAFDEVDIRNILGWVINKIQPLAEQRRIKADIEVVGDVSRIIRDKRVLTQSLLYVVRSEIQSSPPGSHLHIRLAEKNEECICIEINNPSHHISTKAVNELFEKQFETSQQEEISINEIYPARILVRGIGGELEATCEKGKGLTYCVTITKKWRSWMQEVDTLQLAMDISRKEARDTLKNIDQIISLFDRKLPSAIKENFEKLSGKVQELGVLCNRSLFLADDLSNRLESQQDRLLQQEVEQLTTLEAILTSCREIAKAMHAKNIFELDSTRRVAKYALFIAGEFKMSESDRQALRYAALFKDLGLALSPNDMVKQIVTPTVEEAMGIKERCDLVWKALKTIRFLIPALDFIRYRYERYDGKGGRFGVKGNNIPLGARILAIADSFDAMASGRTPEGKLTPKSAMQKIVEDSGLRFDPDVVSAFLLLWKRKELESGLSEN